MKYGYLLLALSLCHFSLAVQADIGVTPITLDLSGKEANTEVAVKNFDTKRNAYVEVTPYRLLHPENPQAKKERVRHPESEGLVVFPAKLVLLPGQTQFVRIVKTSGNLSEDQVFEVDFIPKTASHLVTEKIPDGPVLGVRVIVGYGVRVISRPEVTQPSLSVKRIKNQLLIKNLGNTALAINSCTQDVAGKKTELPLPAYTLFAGQSIKKELSQLSPVLLSASFMGKPLGPFHTD